MIYLVALFCSPLALLLIGKPFQAIANLLIYFLSIFFWLTIIFHFIGFILWACGVLHAILAINSHRADKRTEEVVAALSNAGKTEPAFGERSTNSPGDFSP